MLISNLTFKLTYEMQRQLSTGDKEPTNLLKYAKHCQRVSQRLKDAARTKAALERYIEKRATASTLDAATITTPAKKVSTSTTMQTTTLAAKPSRQRTSNQRKRLMKEKRCFTCKKKSHMTSECLKE